MTVTYNPSLLQNLNNPTTAVTTINNNETAVSSAFQQALNTSGDTMLGILNMNNQQIINLPAPTSNNSPARLADVAPAGTTLIGAVTYNNIQSLPANTILGNPTGVTANATAQTSLTIANQTITSTITGNIINASTATLANLNASSSVGGTLISGTTANLTTSISAPQLITNSTVVSSTGTMGEYQSVNAAVFTNLSNNVVTNLLPSFMTLTPGDWDVWGFIEVQAVGGTLSGNFSAGICNTANSFSNLVSTQGFVQQVGPGSTQNIFSIGPVRQFLASSQTYTINTQCTISAGSMSGIAGIAARRWR